MLINNILEICHVIVLIEKHLQFCIPHIESSGFNFSMSAKPSSFGGAPAFGGSQAPAFGAASAGSQSQGFQFSLNKSPMNKASTPAAVPQSPDADESGNYITKEGDDSHIHFEPIIPLPDKVEVMDG